MEALIKVHNVKLADNLILYFRNNSLNETILFNNVQSEMQDMLNSGVVMPIIFTYILTTLQMLKCIDDYNIVENYNKIEKIISLLYNDEKEKKIVISQIISYCIKGNKKMHDNDKIMNILNKLELHS